MLEAAISRKQPFGQFDRQSYYQQIITSPTAEVEDKSFALYRAIMCYAPSGSNECGGEDVDKQQRKGWFTQLKTQYPGSPGRKTQILLVTALLVGGHRRRISSPRVTIRPLAMVRSESQ